MRGSSAGVAGEGEGVSGALDSEVVCASGVSCAKTLQGVKHNMRTKKCCNVRRCMNGD